MRWLIGFGCLFFLLWGKLTHAQAASGQVTLTWSAVGDDSLSGTAASYSLRYANTRPDTTSAAARDTWWTGASIVSGLPSPLVSGSPQTFSFTIPAAGGRTFYFVLRTTDEAGNISGFSNVASKSFPDSTAPAAIKDLRAQ